ncbi:MAG TPA: metallophosphoesterase [Armatimonadota bacterium]
MIPAPAVLAAMLYPVWEAAQVQVTRPVLRLPRLPQALSGLTLGFLSDLHTERWGRRERNLMRQLEGLEVDLLLLGGDQGKTVPGNRNALRVVRAIRSRHGVYGILGNAEHKKHSPTEGILSFWAANGVTILRNVGVTLNLRGEMLHLLGVDDPSQDRDEPCRAAAGLPTDGFRILLSHSPEGVDLLRGLEIDLVLSGHTHGGQLRIPGLGALYTHSHRGLSYDMGLFAGERLLREKPDLWPKTQLYVSRGVGSAVLPIRFLAPPEVAVITLEAA